MSNFVNLIIHPKRFFEQARDRELSIIPPVIGGEKARTQRRKT